MALLELDQVTKSYYSNDLTTQILRGISFTINEGEFVSIMGPSGSGKSTLLHVLGFLADRTAGTYRFNGKQFAEHTDEEIARVRNEEMGFVFQTFNLLGRNTVFENVRLPLIYSRVPEGEWPALVDQAIAQVKLDHRRDYACSKLSGGEQQRVAIARALVNRPNVLFADEPTGNLDSASGGAVMDTLQHLHEDSGQTVILITHETYTAEHAQRIIKILDGRVEADFRLETRRRASEGYHK